MPQHLYPSDRSDEEQAFVAAYLALVSQDASQRKHDLCRTFDALRYVIRSGCPWRYLPGDFPPWAAVYQQAQRWIRTGVFEQIAHDLRILLRGVADRREHPSAAIFDRLRFEVELGGARNALSLRSDAPLDVVALCEFGGASRPWDTA